MIDLRPKAIIHTINYDTIMMFELTSTFTITPMIIMPTLGKVVFDEVAAGMWRLGPVSTCSILGTSDSS